MMPRYFVPDWVVCVSHFLRFGEKEWAQAEFLVQGAHDVYWVNSIADALEVVKKELEMEIADVRGATRP